MSGGCGHLPEVVRSSMWLASRLPASSTIETLRSRVSNGSGWEVEVDHSRTPFGSDLSRMVSRLYSAARCGWIVALLLAFPSAGTACTLPVFRYALERWPATSFDLYVVHDPKIAPVSPEQAASWAKGIPDSANVLPPVLIDVNQLETKAARKLVKELRTDPKLQRRGSSLPCRIRKAARASSGRHPSAIRFRPGLRIPPRVGRSRNTSSRGIRPSGCW